MIDKKKIEAEAALVSIKDTDKGRNRENYVISALADHENGFREGYIEGAKWAIKDFLKDLWKGTEIEPKIKHQIIAISYEYPPLMLRFFNESTYDWKHFVKSHNIKCWCYIDDILPKEGGSNA